jgi:cytochrome c-type biogenesis protein CcmH
VFERGLSHFVAICTLAVGSFAHAQVDVAAATSAQLEERVNRLSSELRCLVCQNQSVADSHAPLALQLKQEVRKQLSAGATDDAVRTFMVERYGDFVLYRPPLKPGTWALWLGPGALLLLGLAAGWGAVRARSLKGHRLHDDVEVPSGDCS